MQSLHTLVSCFYIAVLFLVAMIFDHPLLLIGVLLVSLPAIAAVGALDRWEGYLRLGIWMTLAIMVINPLVIRAGSTILWCGPALPYLGSLDISLEALCYGAAMGLRLIDLLTIFCLYNEIVDPDKLLGQVSRWAYKTGIMVSLATRLFPAILRDLSNAREVLQLRGVDFNSGNLRERIRKNSLIFKIVLISSLEGSFQTAEAMETRAFGCGPRSCYRREWLRPRDLLCLAGSLSALVLAIGLKMHVMGNFTYYPRLGSLLENPVSWLWPGIMLFGLLLPAALSWGWKLCPFLRSKI